MQFQLSFYSSDFIKEGDIKLVIDKDIIIVIGNITKSKDDKDKSKLNIFYYIFIT